MCTRRYQLESSDVVFAFLRIDELHYAPALLREIQAFEIFYLYPEKRERISNNSLKKKQNRFSVTNKN